MNLRFFTTAIVILSASFAPVSVACAQGGYTPPPQPTPPKSTISAPYYLDQNVPPKYFSGTACGASGFASAGSGAYLKSMSIIINGTEVKKLQLSPPGQTQASHPIGATFASTNFADGSTITVKVTATDNFG